MDISQTESNGITIIALTGRLDATSADPVKQKLLGTIQGKPIRLVVDFAQVTYISSVGLRVLLEVAKRVTAVKGKVALCAMVPHVRQVFDLAGFGSLMPILATRDEAVAKVA